MKKAILFVVLTISGCKCWTLPENSTYENPTTVGGEVETDIGKSCHQGHTVECPQ